MYLFWYLIFSEKEIKNSWKTVILKIKWQCKNHESSNLAHGLKKFFERVFEPFILQNFINFLIVRTRLAHFQLFLRACKLIIMCHFCSVSKGKKGIYLLSFTVHLVNQSLVDIILNISPKKWNWHLEVNFMTFASLWVSLKHKRLILSVNQCLNGLCQQMQNLHITMIFALSRFLPFSTTHLHFLCAFLLKLIYRMVFIKNVLPTK